MNNLKRVLFSLLLVLAGFSIGAQNAVVLPVHPTPVERRAASNLTDLLPSWEIFFEDDSLPNGLAVYVGNTSLSHHYLSRIDSVRDDGYCIFSDGEKAFIYGPHGKGVYYATFALLEHMGWRFTSPDFLSRPLVDTLPHLDLLSNPSFSYREILYGSPNLSRPYADWHGLHNRNDLRENWGMFVHTFRHLVPPQTFFDSHPEWFSEIGGQRVRDGQLCLSNPELVDTLCAHLAHEMSLNPSATIWSVSNNDNYNVCQCPQCRHLDSLYGGPSGTLVHFINQVARRFPDKTISTLAYQFTRQAPRQDCPFPQRPDSNVNIMFCSIECGRQEPIATAPSESSFREDMRNWAALTDNIFMWDYVVQFRNFWDPFPNLHTLQPNLQFFHDNGVRMMFEQGTGERNITAWMDLRCYLLAKLMWNVDANVDSLVHDFCAYHYGPACEAVCDFMTAIHQSLIASGQRLDIYGYPVDGASGYLAPQQLQRYRRHMAEAYRLCEGKQPFFDHVRALELSLDYAEIELTMAGHLPMSEHFQPLVAHFAADFTRLGGKYLHEMGYTIEEYIDDIQHFCEKTFSPNKASDATVTALCPPDSRYAQGLASALNDGKAGILDYRHDWVGFFGDTMDLIVDLGRKTSIHQIQLDFFFYPLSWIFLPSNVRYYASNDGKKWTLIGQEKHSSPELLAVPDIYTFGLDSLNLKKRYLRIVADPLPSIPEWHRATGNKAWIFTDEIIIR